MLHRGVSTWRIKRWRRLSALWQSGSDLERLVALHTGDRVFKWQHYYEIYDRHFGRFRGKQITLLEIGIGYGGSLSLWRQYFGPQAKIVGIDIRPEAQQHERDGIRVFIGSQADPAFLAKVIAEIGPLDILIDDGSHRYEHQLASFQELFRHIKDSGVYACEDLWTSYAKEEYGGGVGEPHTYVTFLKGLIDELNAWYWRDNVEADENAIARWMHGIHFYTALAIIEKRRVGKPVVSEVGRIAP